MAVRPIDGNELVDTLKQVVSDYTSHGMYPSAFPVEYAIEIVEKMPTLTPPKEPLTQAELNSMNYDKVWIDYGGDGEWAMVVYGRIYSLANLEGCGFDDILRDEVAGETMDRPSGDYTVYRRPPEGEA